MLNAVSDPELNLEKVKDITGKLVGFYIVICLINSMVPMLIFLVLTIASWLCKLLALGNLEKDVPELSVPFVQLL